MLFDTLTSCRTWKNVGHFYDEITPNNCTLNVFLKYEVKIFVNNFITNQYDCNLITILVK